MKKATFVIAEKTKFSFELKMSAEIYTDIL